jgi:hypothetical protein
VEAKAVGLVNTLDGLNWAEPGWLIKTYLFERDTNEINTPVLLGDLDWKD